MRLCDEPYSVLLSSIIIFAVQFLCGVEIKYLRPVFGLVETRHSLDRM